MLSNNTLRSTPATRMTAALRCSEVGWKVIPICPKDKKPLIRAWPFEATTNPSHIRVWWNDRPDADIGVVCEPSGLVALGLDTRKSVDWETLSRITRGRCTCLEDLEKLTDWQVQSGGHWYFILRASGGYNRKELIRFPRELNIDNGCFYVVVEPSATELLERLEQGKLPPEAPDWLFKKGNDRRETDGSKATAVLSNNTPRPTPAAADGNPLLTAALKCGEVGLHVIPICPKDKKPLIKRWPSAATTNPSHIRVWWDRWPDANIGVVCGPSGLVVLDVDLYKGVDWALLSGITGGRLSSLADLEKLTDWQAESGGGGRHFILSASVIYDSKELIRFPRGMNIDKKAGNAYFVVAPSVHPKSGKEYRWLTPVPDRLGQGELPPEAPDWLYKKHRGTKTKNNVIDLAKARLQRELPDWLKAALQWCPGEDEGRFAHCWNVGHKLLEHGYSVGEIEAQFGDMPWCSKFQDRGDLRAELERQEEDWLEKGAKCEKSRPRAEDEFEPIDDEASTEGGTTETAEQAPSEEASAPASTLAAAPAPIPFKWIDPAELPKRRWIYNGHYLRAFATGIFAPGAGGKSSQVIAEALAIVTGKPLLGVQPDERCNVWLFNGEDPREELQRRVTAAMLAHAVGGHDTKVFITHAKAMRLQLKPPAVTVFPAAAAVRLRQAPPRLPRRSPRSG
jgi:hypothetical protein